MRCQGKDLLLGIYAASLLVGLLFPSLTIHFDPVHTFDAVDLGIRQNGHQALSYFRRIFVIVELLQCHIKNELH